jgi:hypothetical protein
MNFTQRVAWTLLFFYLGLTFVFLYAWLETPDYLTSAVILQDYKPYRRKTFILDSSTPPIIPSTDDPPAPNAHHQNAGKPDVEDFTHLLIVICGVLTYMQLFVVLLACTQANPQQHLVAICVPIVGWACLLNRLHRSSARDASPSIETHGDSNAVMELCLNNNVQSFHKQSSCVIFPPGSEKYK